MIRDHSHIAIKLTGISKKYEIHHEKPTLVEKFVKAKNETFWALKDIHLVVKRGERLGIIGPNGSGKTTLLKVLTGITAPTTGTVETQGRTVSLIDLEAGFHPDLTGEQNIMLNGMLLGVNKKEIKKKSKHIIAFADIGQFIDTPLYTYSSGMKLRLGFAIAVYANPEILILDEGLAVGDLNFQKKSHAKIQEFIRQGKTIILASQWLDLVRKNCSRIIIMKNGKITKEGGTEIISHYH